MPERRPVLSSLVLVLAPLAVACAAHAPPTTETIGARKPGNTTAAPQVTAESLAGVLRERGYPANLGGFEAREEIPVDGQMIFMGNGQFIEVYEFASTSARVAWTAELGEDGCSYAGEPLAWPGTKHFWAKGSALVVYIGTSDSLVAALRRVLGPPFTNGHEIGDASMHPLPVIEARRWVSERLEVHPSAVVVTEAARVTCSQAPVESCADPLEPMYRVELEHGEHWFRVYVRQDGELATLHR